MKLLILAAEGPELDALRSNLTGMRIDEIRTASSWPLFMQAVAEARPDLAIVSFAALRDEGEDAVTSADMTLRALGQPFIICLTEELADERFRLEMEMETEFEHFVTLPSSPTEFAAMIFRSRTGDAAVSTLRPTTDADAGAADEGDIADEPDHEGEADSEDATPEDAASADSDGAEPSDPEDDSRSPDTAEAARPEQAETVEEDLSGGDGGGPDSPLDVGVERTSDVTVEVDAVTLEAYKHSFPTKPGMEALTDAEASPDEAAPDAAADDEAEAPVDADDGAGDEGGTFERTGTAPGRVGPGAAGPDDHEVSGGHVAVVDEDSSAVDEALDSLFGVVDASATVVATPPAAGASSPAETGEGAEAGDPDTAEAGEAEDEGAADVGTEKVDGVDETAGAEEVAGAEQAAEPPAEEPPAEEAPAYSKEEAEARAEAEIAAAAAAAAASPAEETGAEDSSRPSRQDSEVREKTISVRAHISGGIPIVPVEGGRPHTVKLPDPNGGNIATAPVPWVLHALNVLRATGELLLENATLARRVMFFAGEAGTVDRVPKVADERKLLSTFSWHEGVYQFQAYPVAEASFFTFGEPLELIHRGIERHIGMNESATALGPYLKKYPIVTDQLARTSHILGLEDLARFTARTDGTMTLEALMVSAGADTEATLRNAYFGWLTGIVVFLNESETSPLCVSFESAPMIDVEGRPVHESIPGGVSDVHATVPNPGMLSGSQRAVSSDETHAHRETFERLGQQWDKVSSQDAYEVFGLEPGCGVDTVNKRFYDLVREYHPDRYAQIQNTQIKTLAEKIFVHVRGLHTDLVTRERTGDYRPTAGKSASVQAGGDDVGSRAARRRAGSTAASGAQRRTAGPGPDASGAATRSRNVGEALNRLRNRGATPSAASAAVDAEPRRRSTASHRTLGAARQMKPEQLLRNAKKATAQGNDGKALDLVSLARTKGMTGSVIDGYEIYLTYSVEGSGGPEALERLEELREKTEGGVEESEVLTLAGHICRLEEAFDEASKFYVQATDLWGDNEEASRWLRHLKKRDDETKKKKSPFSNGFLNKLFSAKSK